MKTRNILYPPCRWGLCGLICSGVVCVPSARAAITNVTVSSYTFNPPAVTIHVNDQVQWNWSGGFHSTTSDTGLWDSTVVSSGTYTHTFTSAGTFPYHCTPHAGPPFNMRASVTVLAAANVPPSVAITAPAGGAIFAAPWTGSIRATAADSDDSVATVDFFAGTNLLGTITNPPANLSFAVTNLPAGDYTLTARATDSQGASTVSASVSISVVTPSPIVLGSPQRLANGFQFTYTANPGLSYVVRRSGSAFGWIPLSTNTALASPVTFYDNAATDSSSFYSVQLLPNP